MHKSKKIISIVAAATLGISALALSGCGDQAYKGEDLGNSYVSEAQVSSNGGFVVEKGDYVYFINGSESNTADNTYGDVVKGSLMRISKAQLAAGQYSEAQIVVPSLFVTGNYDGGIYIYGDYVYYATPTTDKTNKGDVSNSSIDFKRARIDGKKAPMDGKNSYLFRLTSNSAKYRFVEVDGVVYCMYEESSQLKSYNVSTGKTTVLVKGASSFYYDADPASANVYYTMSVSYDIEKANPTTANYNQIYCVNPASYATVNKAEASYEVKNGDTVVAKYDFDEKLMKDNAEEKGYDLADYTTYPYVNLGKLVLDGVGSKSGSSDTTFNVDKDSISSADTINGYTYAIQRQANDGIYFTRTDGTENDPNASKLYYLPATGANGNTVTANKSVDIVALDTTNAGEKTLFEVKNDGANRVHSYYYLSGSTLKKATADATGKATAINLAYELATDLTLWKVDGNYLYYYGTGTNGKSLNRINCTGSEDDYSPLYATDEYKPLTVALVDFNDSWYKPEFVTAGEKQFVLYSNAQSYGAGATAYNYIYAAKLGTTADIIASNEGYEAVNDYINEYGDNTQIQAVMKYHFRTQKTDAYDAVKDLYNDDQQKYFDDFKAKFETEFKYENNYVALLGRMDEADVEDINEAWADSLLKEKEEAEEEKGLEPWAIALIVVGSVLVVAAAVVIPVIVINKKKKAEKARKEAIVSAYKHKKLDTTDDKSIDVYADETTEEEAPVSEEAPKEE